MKTMRIFLLLVLFLSLKLEAASLPNFNLSRYPDGTPFRLSENLKGKKMLINFWATWCTSCIHELPLLESLKEKYGSEVTFVSVNAGEKTNLMDRFFKKYKFSYVHLKDEERIFSKSIGVDSLPVTIVVDKDMNIIYRGVTPPKEI